MDDVTLIKTLIFLGGLLLTLALIAFWPDKKEDKNKK